MVREVELFKPEEKYSIDRKLIDAIALPVGDHYGDEVFSDYLDWYAGVARKFKPKRIFEVGVRYGYIGLCLCYAIRKLRGQPGVEYLGIDDESYHRDSNAQANRNFAEVLPDVPMKAMTWNSITQGLPPGIGTFDLVHIDGNHDERHVLGDLNRCWPVVNPGGIVLLDDAKPWDDQLRPGPIWAAVQTFLKEHENDDIEWQYLENLRGLVIVRRCA